MDVANEYKIAAIVIDEVFRATISKEEIKDLLKEACKEAIKERLKRYLQANQSDGHRMEAFIGPLNILEQEHGEKEENESENHPR